MIDPMMVARLETALTCPKCGIYRYSIFHPAKCSDRRKPRRKRGAR